MSANDCPSCEGYGNIDKYPATHVPKIKVCLAHNDLTWTWRPGRRGPVRKNYPESVSP